MRGSIPLAVVALLTAASCSQRASDFSTANARAHVEHLAGTIGSRPAGTAANARARGYLVEHLERHGFRVRVQAADASNPQHGISGRVHNIVAVKDGARRDALGLVAHYDSVPEGPGAADDGFGTAVVAEAARVLAGRANRRWSLMVLLTDAEEDGLLGAAAAVDDPEVRERLKAVVNVESIGADAPVLLFETGPGNGWLAGVWARAVPHPRGGSFNYEIYRRMPNDTDFSVFKRAGIPGLNFAAVGDMYAYHTALDVPARVTTRALADAGAAVVALADALEEEDLLRREDEPATYFDVAGLTALSWSPATDRVLVMLAVVLGAIAWLRVASACRHAARLRGVALALAWAIVGACLVAGAAIGAVALLRAVREVYHPWHARPGRFALVIVLAGLSAGWLLWRLAAHLPPALRLPRDAACVWTPALAVWIAAAAAMGWSAPRAGYLWILPLLAVAAPVAVAGAGRNALLAGSAIGGTVASVLWLPDVATFTGFLVALMGTFPVVSPPWLLPAVPLLGAVMVAPPLIALGVASGARRPRYLTRALLVALGLAVGWAYRAPAYTPDRPMRLALVSTGTGGAGADRSLAIAGNEPVLDLGRDAPVLSPVRALSPLEQRLAGGAPFVVAGSVPAAPAAGSVTCDEAPAAGGVEVRVIVSPAAEGLHARLELPPSVLPLRSNWPGVVRENRWSAAFAGVPADGVTFRLGLDAALAGRACGGRVLLRRPRPADAGEGRPPAWLARPGVAWEFLVVDVLPLR